MFLNTESLVYSTRRSDFELSRDAEHSVALHRAVRAQRRQNGRIARRSYARPILRRA
jgi:hypothetical protein